MSAIAWLVASLVLLGVGGQLFARWRKKKVPEGVLKALSSAGLLVFAALLDSGGGYGFWIKAGLVCSFVGDVLLIKKGRLWLGLGLGAFLLAHLYYLGASMPLVDPMRVSPLGLTIVVTAASLAGMLTFRAILPGLGPLLVPSLVYTVILCGMTIAALCAWQCDPADTGRILLGLGALLFLVSDVAVALQRFVGDSLRIRLWGLPSYFVAQLLLAASTGFVR